MSLLQKLSHLGACGVKAGEYGEDGFAAGEDLLVQRLVGFVEGGEARGAVDDSDGVDVVELMFAEVDGGAQLLSGACGQDIDGVGDGGAGEEALL